MRLRKRGLLWGLAMVALAALPVRGEEPEDRSITMPARESFRKPYDSSEFGVSDDAGFQRRIKITVSPATFPYPLLKHRFNIYSTEWESGNAAPLYSQAHAEFRRIYAEAEKNWFASNTYYELKKSGASENKIQAELFRAVPLVPEWGYAFPKTVSPEEEANFYRSMEPVFDLLEKASRMREADWSHQMEYKGIATSLVHLQNMRALARYLSGKSDWEIRNGRYEDAVKTLRVGLAMGNHVEKSNFPTLIGMLVGIAVQGIMQYQITILESQPDAPNLYPALTQVVLPADALQYAIQGEPALFFPGPNPMPIFEKVDKASPEECRQKLEGIVLTLFQVQTNRWLEQPEKAKIDATLITICTLCYPPARDRLLDQGRTAEEIDKLSVYQVVAPYVLEQIKAAYDRLVVMASFPAGSSHTAITEEPVGGSIQSPVDAFLMLITPALSAARRACDRQGQTLELLKIVEAIRYYAAVHDGRLPESLEAIKEVPIATVDPVSGKPFGYKVEGRTALVDFTQNGKCRMEITVEEPAAKRKAGK